MFSAQLLPKFLTTMQDLHLMVMSANQKRLAELAKQYAVRPQGVKGTYWIIKTATNQHTHQEMRLKRSLHTVDLRAALVKAVPMVEAWLKGVRSKSASVIASSEGINQARIVAAYLAAPTVRANLKTRERNVADWRRIFEEVYPGVDFDSASIELADRELAKAYQRKKLAEIEAACAGDVLAAEASKRAINSTLAHAQSVFSRHALEDYHGLGLPPVVRDFADALPVKARPQEEPVQLDDAAVTAMMGKVAALKVEEPAAWVVFQLMLWGGLRNIDCVHARRSWVSASAGGYRVSLVPGDDYMPKGRSGSVIVPAVVMEEVLELSAPKAGETESAEVTGARHLVPASSKTARDVAAYRTLNDWLKSNGVGEESNKVAYRLRKYFLSKVEEQQGRVMASLAARHADAATLDHYVARPKMEKPITLGA